MTTFEQYLRHLLDLHRAMEEKNEPLADELRDKMDKPWYELTGEKFLLVEHVSAALLRAEEQKVRQSQ